MDNIKKLYGATSFIDSLKDRKDVRVDWFRAGPKRHNINYGQLIKDYDRLDENEISTAEEIIDEFFTREEIEILREYLMRMRCLDEGDFLVSQFMVPIRVKRETGELLSTVGDISYPCNTLFLSREPGYDSPFKVWGHFNIDNHCPADRLPWEDEYDEIEFLN